MLLVRNKSRLLGWRALSSHPDDCRIAAKPLLYLPVCSTPDFRVGGQGGSSPTQVTRRKARWLVVGVSRPASRYPHLMGVGDTGGRYVSGQWSKTSDTKTCVPVGYWCFTPSHPVTSWGWEIQVGDTGGRYGWEIRVIQRSKTSDTNTGVLVGCWRFTPSHPARSPRGDRY